jgi:CheY-like chemotaxis protein
VRVAEAFEPRRLAAVRNSINIRMIFWLGCMFLLLGCMILLLFGTHYIVLVPHSWLFAAGPGWERRIGRVSKSQIVSIVDDDASVRAAMQSLLRSLGLVAFVFESAEDFLRSPRVGDSSCLITDVQMPGMSGLDLQDCLIAQGTHIPTIFITAFPQQSIRSRAQAGGALGLLEKPFAGRTMIELVRQALATQPR